MKLCSLVTLALLASSAAPVPATTHVVDVNGGADYTAIIPAVSAASEGDTILVYPGTYTGEDNRNIGRHGMNLVFLAVPDSRAPVTIDGTGTTSDRGFYFHDGEDATTLVHGFTIQNFTAQSGAGIRIVGASPTIESCVFLGNHATSQGGAVYLVTSSSMVSDCVFRGNSAALCGGAVYTLTASPTVTGCLFDENTSGTMDGGAMFCDEGSESILFCTMVENGLNQIRVNHGSGVDLDCCIIANASDGVGVSAYPSTGAWITRSILFGNPGGDVPECQYDEILFEDPLFCDDAVDDYTLCSDSSAVPENNSWLEQVGAFGPTCPPCGTPVESATWGSMKALFR